MKQTDKQLASAALWHLLSVEATLAELASRPGGLEPEEARERLRQFGPNALIDRGGRTAWAIIRDQLLSAMVLLLVGAGIVSLLLGEYTDAGVIFAIVVLNAVLGFFQEFRAERALQALKRLAVPLVRVLRSGRVTELPAHELVPGDIVPLEAGCVVPADGRLLEAVNLRIQEAALTGESEPVDKTVAAMTEGDTALGDRRNMAYMGTAVVAGRGLLVVTETGMRTELGRIADLLQSVDREPTPLQRRMAQLSRGLLLAVVGLVAVVFVVGLLSRAADVRTLVLTAISMAVAAVPEALPAVITIALALGAQRMLGRRALMRKLPAVETLGSVDVICSDKTGTLTENRMTVTVLDVAGHRVEVTPETTADELAAATVDLPGLQIVLAGGALCNDAQLEVGSDGRHRAIGDPTEGALVVAAARFGLPKPELEKQSPRLAEVPFSPERRRMTTMHMVGGRLGAALAAVGLNPPVAAITKGAVDALLEHSTQALDGRCIVPMTDAMRRRIEAAQDEFARSGMRVLGIGIQPLSPDSDVTEADRSGGLVFVGLVAMIDPARPEARAAVETCRAAGVRPVMITGDHPLTARAIALKLGIAGVEDRVLTGSDLAAREQEQLAALVEETSVYARVAPEQKLAIVEALQQRGHVVAMTGDGVNDAPALRRADIGVAMGITGTDVSKEAADMVLLDDNFATIVAAVEEGRVIYDNIRKFLKYTLTSNAGEIWVMLLSPFLGMPMALLPVQILWVNLVTDGLPGLALTVEPAERDTMRRPPRHPAENIFGRGLAVDVVWVGLLMGVVSLATGFAAWLANPDGPWQTMVFTTLTLSQMGNVLAMRSERDSFFAGGRKNNRLLAVAVLLTLVLQLLVTYVPFLQRVFYTKPLSPVELGICLAASTVVFWANELAKLGRRLAGRRQANRPA